METTTGYDEEKIAGMAITDFFSEDHHNRISDAIEETFENGEVTVEAELRTAQDERIPYEFTGARLTDADDTLVGFVGVGRDISEQKKREQKLELVETLFRHAEEYQLIVGIADGTFELRHANDYYKGTSRTFPRRASHRPDTDGLVRGSRWTGDP